MKGLLIFFLITAAVTANSCYSDEINMKTDAHYSATYSTDSTHVYFVAQTRAWQAAKGLSAMPDGGKPKELFKDVSLYSYDIQTGNLIRLLEMGQLPYSPVRWKFMIIPQGNEISFSLEPLSGWEKEIEYNPEMVTIRNNLDHVFLISDKGEVTTGASHFPAENIRKTELSALHRHINDLPLSSFGLILEKICPAGEKRYISDLVSLSNTSSYRRAVIEQVVAGKDKNTIRSILEKMTGSIEELSGASREEMKIKEKKNLELLKGMLGE